MPVPGISPGIFSDPKKGEVSDLGWVLQGDAGGFRDMQVLCPRSQFGEEFSAGAGHPGLGSERAYFVVKRGAAMKGK